jgi:diguanylate cyclase (GGDEF)-like protein
MAWRSRWSRGNGQAPIRAAPSGVGAAPGASGPRLWVRLLAVLAVPLITLATGAAVLGLQRQHAARRAAAMECTAGELATVVRLGSHLVDESAGAAIPIAARAFNVPPAQLRDALRFDPVAYLKSSRAAVDADLAALGDQEWLRPLRAALNQVRSIVDTGARLSVLDAVRYGDVESVVSGRAQALARELDVEGDSLPGTGMNAAVQRLRIGYETLLAATDELPVYFMTFLAPKPGNLGREDLASVHTTYKNLMVLLSQTTAPELAEWTALVNDPGSRAFTTGVDRLLAEPVTPRVLPPDVMLGMFNGAENRTALLRNLVEKSIRAVDDGSMRAADDAQRSLRIAGAGACLVVLLSLLGTWQIARTVGRPMQVLADRARRLSDGHLDPTPVRARGAREVVAVTEAVNDMVTNLDLVHRQADALARGDLTDQSLAAVAPGALGASMQRSVERLSDSLAARDVLERRLRHEATHDTLTGLLNRAAATVSLAGVAGRVRRSGEHLAVLLLDLDDFKAVNDAHGQRVGDAVLRLCGRRFSRVTDDFVAVARVDSDEFVLVAEVPDPRAAVWLAERAVAAIGQPLEFGDARLRVTASVGVVLATGGETAESMLRDAGSAVRRAKVAGGDRAEVFDAELRRQLAERDVLDRALRSAVDSGGLDLHYQPVVDATSGRLRGFEALCRWTDPHLGVVEPDKFIAVAEGSDLILELDRWVLSRATWQLASWLAGADGFSHPDTRTLHVAVNISGRHLLRGDLVRDVRQALGRAELDPRRLVLEITETVLLTEPATVASTLTALRELGVRIAIDDFGTGYTSIGQLRELPVDVLKVDRSLVSRVDDPAELPLVNLLVQTAHILGLAVVAEGADSIAQLTQLRGIGCDLVQGYVISRPLPGPAAAAWAQGVPWPEPVPSDPVSTVD